MSEESFGNYLRRRFHDWTGRQLGRDGRIPSQAEFAKWIGVPTTSMSVWMNDIRKPTGESVDKLAERLGVEVYDRLGLPRKMPRNKKLYFLASIWDKLPQSAQDELYERAQTLLEQHGPANLRQAR